MRLINLFIVLLALNMQAMAQQPVWLDADTGNEMDDLYAIVRLLKEPSVQVLGLSSAHFNNPDILVFEKWNAYDTKGLKTIVESQRVNEQILQALGRTDIPHPQGADRQIGRAWGERDARPSPASEGIIAAARALPVGQQLHVITIGAMTNIASALIAAPDILPRIKLFALGAQYNPKTKAWNKNEFNIRNDLNAFDYLLDLEGLDFTIMPIDAAFLLQFKRDEVYARMNEKVAIEKILVSRWREQNPQDEQRVIWDLALIEAYLNPQLATLKRVNTPPENKQRKVGVYTHIQASLLANDFWMVLKK